jgi:hypothetical protein
MATKHTTIGSGINPLHRHAENDTEAAKELSAAYQAGFDAGFIMGRQASLKEPEDPAGAPQLARVNKRTRVPGPARVRRRVASQRFLLGLPCRSCGAYYGSDEKRCPVCKTTGKQASVRPITSASAASWKIT